MAKNAMIKVSNSVSKVVADTKNMSPINLAILVVSVAIVVVLVVLLVKHSKREGFALMNLSDASWVTKGEDGAQGPPGTDAGFPSGVIVAYNSDIAPPGWILCDGISRNGVSPPDLRGRFILGSGKGEGLTSRQFNTKGGAETHTLTIAEMPAHTHKNNMARGSGSSCSHIGVSGCGAGSYDSLVKNVGSTGGGAEGLTEAHNNMPPFYVLTYIMKL